MTPQDRSLKIAVSRTGAANDIMVIRVDGMVDTISAGNMEDVLTSLVTQGRYRILIDLAGTNYISSAGWGTFVSRLRDIREQQGDIKLARMTPEVREIYDLLEFEGLLPHFTSLDAAIADFNGGKPTEQVTIPQDADPLPGPEKPRAQPMPADEEIPPAPQTVDDAVRQAVLEDPFQSIGEIRDFIRECASGVAKVSWWKVFGSLRRQRLLARRARFRLYRRHWMSRK